MELSKINKRKWIVYWEWMNEAARPADEIVAIFDSRYSYDKVSFLVNIIYKQAHLTLCEMSSCKINDYKPERQFDGRMICGVNPTLVAEIADIICVSRNEESWLETVEWRPHHLSSSGKDKNGNIIVSRFQPLERKSTRLIAGPISYEMIWDRSKKRVKDRFKNN